ncbi:cytoplasmic protein [Tremella mesenterica]|uniref:Cytoplasmic protein n=1 Tax=Tremella mesenterica TaxID=5217 RepID=A0A4Q1BHJ5_TREME|nr:cytoplasmic protein [Tremella mesenterica]
MADVKKKQLVFNFIEFLRASAADGTVKEDDKESLEVAVQCIAESFGVDPDSPEQQAQYSIQPTSLLSLLDVYLKTKAKTGPAPSSSSAPAPAQQAGKPEPNDGDRIKADQYKVDGNAFMGQKLYDLAIEKYTEAIKLDPTAVYYSNRAAAWGALGKHEKAVEDAEKALELDPKFAKAYSRLGHAQFSIGNYSAAIGAYESGLELDPSNNNMKTALTTARSREAEDAARTREVPRGTAPSGAAAPGGMPDLSALASMFGGGGGGGGGEGAGGMPDMASLLRNPQMMAMAQQMMANGGLERLMQNPAMRNVAENMQNGGGMPDFTQLASDPSLRDM